MSAAGPMMFVLALSVGLAEGSEHLPVDLRVHEDRVLASFSVDAAIDEEFRRRMAGGLESRVEILTQLTDARGQVVGRGQRSCKLLYSLWDEQTFATIADAARPPPGTETFETVETAVKACVEVEELPVALAGALTLADGYHLRVRVILNPVSEEMVERSRQFITNPQGGARTGPNSVLGALAGLLGDDEGPRGPSAVFRSERLTRPSRLARVGRPSTGTATAGPNGARP